MAKLHLLKESFLYSPETVTTDADWAYLQSYSLSPDVLEQHPINAPFKNLAQIAQQFLSESKKKVGSIERFEK